MMVRFAMNQRVRWDPEATKVPGGIGTVKGVASTEMPVVGHLMIVEVDDTAALAAKDYHYSTVVLSEHALKLEPAFSTSS